MSQLKDVNTPLPDVGFRFARILLILSLIFLPVLAFTDYQNGYTLPAYAKGFVVLVCAVGYFLCRDQSHQDLVRFGVAASLLVMASVGALYKLDGFNGLVWVPVLPLLFIFLVGSRKGAAYAATYFIIYGISYFSFEVIHNKEPVELSAWLLTMFAYVFVLTVTILFQKEIQKDENQLRNVASYDYLTQVFNRRGFVPRMEEEVEKISRYGGKLSIITVDIDNFKQVNDKYGHGVGDELLAEFAELLEQQTRSIDMVARWGGEEFVILAPCTGLEDCADLAEKLRMSVDSHRFSTVGQITASFGVAEYQTHEAWQAFLNRADVFLLAAKQNGKNCVAVNTPIGEVLLPDAVA